MPDDYGCFGKGFTGYAHYMQAFARNNSRKKRPSGGRGGCLTTLLLLALCVAILLCFAA